MKAENVTPQIPADDKKTMLTLPIKTRWLEMIITGEKLEEYREIKPYWEKRFEKVFGDFQPHVVRFRAGYGRGCSYADCLVSLDKGYGVQAWGAEPDKKYFILHIKNVSGYYRKEL